MDLSQAITDMLVSLADKTPQIQSVLSTAPTTWIVSFSDVLSVEIDYVASGDRLGFQVALEAPSDANRAAVVEALLTYNLMWRETGGVRFGMAGASGQVFMIAEAFLPEMSEAMMASILLSLSEKAQEFTDFIRSGPKPSDATPTSEDTFMIRI